MQLFLRVLSQQGRLDEVLDWALDGRAGFLVTCVGAPAEILPRVRDAGVKLYHQTGSLNDALKAVDAGADGLIVEGAESGGLRSTRSLHLFSFLQQVRSRVDVPLVAGGGIVDGKGMAGAFALGAEGVMMGTRFITSAESPVHVNVKEAIVQAAETVNLEPVKKGIMMRFVRNEVAEAVARGDIDPKGQPYAGPVLEMFDNGDLNLAMVGAGESAALFSEIKTAATIIDETVTGFWQEIERLGALIGDGRRVLTGTEASPERVGGPALPRWAYSPLVAMSVFWFSDWYGSALNRAARLMAIGHGGQVLVSAAAAELARHDLRDAVLVDLGRHRLGDLAEPEHVWQVAAEGLDHSFPALRGLSAALTNLPSELTSFLGRRR